MSLKIPKSDWSLRSKWPHTNTFKKVIERIYDFILAPPSSSSFGFSNVVSLNVRPLFENRERFNLGEISKEKTFSEREFVALMLFRFRDCISTENLQNLFESVFRFGCQKKIEDPWKMRLTKPLNTPSFLPTCLSELPQNVLSKIARNCTHQSLRALSQTCSRFYAFVWQYWRGTCPESHAFDLVLYQGAGFVKAAQSLKKNQFSSSYGVIPEFLSSLDSPFGKSFFPLMTGVHTLLKWHEEASSLLLIQKEFTDLKNLPILNHLFHSIYTIFEPFSLNHAFEWKNLFNSLNDIVNAPLHLTLKDMLLIGVRDFQVQKKVSPCDSPKTIEPFAPIRVTWMQYNPVYQPDWELKLLVHVLNFQSVLSTSLPHPEIVQQLQNTSHSLTPLLVKLLTEQHAAISLARKETLKVLEDVACYFFPNSKPEINPTLFFEEFLTPMIKLIKELIMGWENYRRCSYSHKVYTIQPDTSIISQLSKKLFNLPLPQSPSIYSFQKPIKIHFSIPISTPVFILGSRRTTILEFFLSKVTKKSTFSSSLDIINSWSDSEWLKRNASEFRIFRNLVQPCFPTLLQTLSLDPESELGKAFEPFKKFAPFFDQKVIAIHLIHEIPILQNSLQEHSKNLNLKDPLFPPALSDLVQLVQTIARLVLEQRLSFEPNQRKSYALKLEILKSVAESGPSLTDLEFFSQLQKSQFIDNPLDLEASRICNISFLSFLTTLFLDFKSPFALAPSDRSINLLFSEIYSLSYHLSQCLEISNTLRLHHSRLLEIDKILSKTSHLPSQTFRKNLKSHMDELQKFLNSSSSSSIIDEIQKKVASQLSCPPDQAVNHLVRLTEVIKSARVTLDAQLYVLSNHLSQTLF